MSVFMSRMKLFSSILILLTLIGCSKSTEPEEKENLLIFCGITMIPPMQELAKEFEQIHSVNITLTQGGSQDLYDSIKLSGEGDLYLPGSPHYRVDNLKDGILLDHVFVGYNRVAMMVQKGNPKNLTADLDVFVSPSVNTVLANPQTGSIGKASQKVLEKSGLYEKAYAHAVYLTTDSRRLVQAMKNKEADATLNWYAVGTWDKNQDFIDTLLLPEEISKPKTLEISLLKYSSNPELAREFMEYASGAHGREVFKRYGFLTQEEYEKLRNL